MKQLIVGDIHGCYDELIRLVAKADLSPGDEIKVTYQFLNPALRLRSDL